MEAALDSYLARLQKESKRRREPFKADRRTEDGRQAYHWTGDGQGRGSIFCLEDTVYFIEVTGGRRDSLLPYLKSSLASFRAPCAELTLWSVLGLSLRLPRDYQLEKHLFQAGRTELRFTARSGRLECIRWGFAAQLLERYSLGAWARSALSMASAHVEADPSGVCLRTGGAIMKKVALVRLQPEHNQIITVKGSFRNDKAAPHWDWFEEESPAEAG